MRQTLEVLFSSTKTHGPIVAIALLMMTQSDSSK